MQRSFWDIIEIKPSPVVYFITKKQLQCIPYSISQEACTLYTAICCAMLCFDIGRYYPYSSGLLLWHKVALWSGTAALYYIHVCLVIPNLNVGYHPRLTDIKLIYYLNGWSEPSQCSIQYSHQHIIQNKRLRSVWFLGTLQCSLQRQWTRTHTEQRRSHTSWQVP